MSYIFISWLCNIISTIDMSLDYITFLSLRKMKRVFVPALRAILMASDAIKIVIRNFNNVLYVSLKIYIEITWYLSQFERPIRIDDYNNSCVMNISDREALELDQGLS